MDGIAIFSAFLQGLGIVAFAGRLHELAITRCTSPRWETAATALTFAVAAAVSPATSAIMPVHLYGQPVAMAPLQALAAAQP